MRVKAIGMSRGLLIVDENNAAVIPFLQQKNIRVQTPQSGTPDEKIIEAFLSHRIFVTNNTKDFIDYVSEYEFGLISTESIKNKEGKALAKIISDAIKNLDLWTKPKPWVLELKDDGKHKFKKFPT